MSKIDKNNNVTATRSLSKERVKIAILDTFANILKICRWKLHWKIRYLETHAENNMGKVSTENYTETKPLLFRNTKYR